MCLPGWGRECTSQRAPNMPASRRNWTHSAVTGSTAGFAEGMAARPAGPQVAESANQHAAQHGSGRAAEVRHHDLGAFPRHLDLARVNAGASLRFHRLRQKLLRTARVDHVHPPCHARLQAVHMPGGARRAQATDSSTGHAASRCADSACSCRSMAATRTPPPPESARVMKREQCSERTARGHADGGDRFDAHALCGVVEHRDDDVEFAATALRERMKPVPAAIEIRQAALIGAQQTNACAVGEGGPARCVREIQRALLAAVQDHDQRRDFIVGQVRGRCRDRSANGAR